MTAHAPPGKISFNWMPFEDLATALESNVFSTPRLDKGQRAKWANAVRTREFTNSRLVVLGKAGEASCNNQDLIRSLVYV